MDPEAELERERAHEQGRLAERARVQAARMAGDLAAIARAQAAVYELRERMHLTLARGHEARAAGDYDSAVQYLIDAEELREKAEAAERRAEHARRRASRSAFGGLGDPAPEPE